MWMLTSVIVLLQSTACYGETYRKPLKVAITLDCNTEQQVTGTEGSCTNLISTWRLDPKQYSWTVRQGDQASNDAIPTERFWGPIDITGLVLSDQLSSNAEKWENAFSWNAGTACSTKDSICKAPVKCKLKQSYKANRLETMDSSLSGTQQFGGVVFSTIREFNDVCVFCPPVPCTTEEKSCRNGFVMPSPGLQVGQQADQNGYRYAYTKAQCTQACESGYWLTCINSDRSKGCSYMAPSADVVSVAINADASDQSRKMQIARWIGSNRAAFTLLPVPMTVGYGLLINKCYPCLFANGVSHYGEPLLLTDSALVSQGYLSFYCPGGDSAPVPCPVNMLSRIDPNTNTSSECNCKPGYYKNGNVCDLCPAGQFCAFGSAPVDCPVDHYSLSGASACTPCRTDAGVCGANFALRRCIGGPAFQNRDADCVDCQSCQTGSVSAGSVPCQRVGVPAQV